MNLTTQEKYDLNIYNGDLVGVDALTTMCFLSDKIGIDKKGIDLTFNWFGQLIYLRKKFEFSKQPRDNKGRFKKN